VTLFGLLPRLAEEDELDAEDAAHPTAKATPDVDHGAVPWRRLVTLAGVALAARVGYLFLFTDPQNAGDGFTDAYHHWQIAYLTKTIGLSHGPRLWDMRGWEYFWGPVHPLLSDVLFFATGSTSIVVTRLLSALFGTAAVALIFALCHRYWGGRVATVATAFAALSPVSIFNDTAGMAEPIAIALILFGIWLAPRHGFWAGVVWAVAAMARVEAWLIGLGLVVAWVVGSRRGRTSRAPLVIGWLLVMAVYAKVLLDQTGNPIYPLWVNFQFVGLAAGATGGQAAGPLWLWAIFAVAALGCLGAAAWAMWTRPPSYLVLVYGFGYTALSLATYLRYATEWKERRFELPLEFAAVLAAVALVRGVPAVRPALRPLGAAAAAAGIAVSQLLWLPVQSTYASTEPLFQYESGLGRQIAAVSGRPEYRGGALNMPGDEPTLLYVLVQQGGITGDRVVSQFYDPFYYLPAGYSYAAHREVAGTLLQCWLATTHTRLLLISPPGPLSASNGDYEAFIADHPGWFTDTGALPNGWKLYGVDVPAPSAADCAAAAKAAQS